MKKILIFSFFFLALSKISFAQSTPADTLKQYVGDYVMKEGSPFEKLTVSLTGNDLFVEADANGSNKIIKQKEAETFKSTSAYGSIIIFVRNTEKKIIGLKMIIQETELLADKKP